NGQIYISPGGALITSQSGTRRQLAWFGRDGSVRPVTHEARAYVQASLSPDESRVAVTMADGQATDIWILDLATSGLTRLTSVQSAGIPVWSNDGRRIYFIAT